MGAHRPGTAVARIEELEVQNHRALENLHLRDLTPVTVLLGPNGRGKSTVSDGLAFLSECFTEGLRRAWDRRGRFEELRSRGAEGPTVLDLKGRSFRCFLDGVRASTHETNR